MDQANTQFKPTLGLMDATMIVAGSMIGSGIFIVSADITRNVGSAGWLIVVGLITGFMTLTAANKFCQVSPELSCPTTLMIVVAAPSEAVLMATFPAPPIRFSDFLTATTGTGASGEIRSTTPQQ